MKQGTRIVLLLVLLMGMTTGAMVLGHYTDRFTGLVIWMFLGYCAIIVVAQLISALFAVGSLLQEMVEKKPKARRLSLR